MWSKALYGKKKDKYLKKLKSAFTWKQRATLILQDFKFCSYLFIFITVSNISEKTHIINMLGLGNFRKKQTCAQKQRNLLGIVFLANRQSIWKANKTHADEGHIIITFSLQFSSLCSSCLSVSCSCLMFFWWEISINSLKTINPTNESRFTPSTS